MSNQMKDINIKNQLTTFSVILSIYDPNNIKTDEKCYKNILVCYIGYVTIKDTKYVKNDDINPLYIIINKWNGYYE